MIHAVILIPLVTSLFYQFDFFRKSKATYYIAVASSVLTFCVFGYQLIQFLKMGQVSPSSVSWSLMGDRSPEFAFGGDGLSLLLSAFLSLLHLVIILGSASVESQDEIEQRDHDLSWMGLGLSFALATFASLNLWTYAAMSAAMTMSFLSGSKRGVVDGFPPAQVVSIFSIIAIVIGVAYLENIFSGVNFTEIQQPGFFEQLSDQSQGLTLGACGFVLAAIIFSKFAICPLHFIYSESEDSSASRSYFQVFCEMSIAFILLSRISQITFSISGLLTTFQIGGLVTLGLAALMLWFAVRPRHILQSSLLTIAGLIVFAVGVGQFSSAAAVLFVMSLAVVGLAVSFRFLNVDLDAELQKAPGLKLKSRSFFGFCLFFWATLSGIPVLGGFVVMENVLWGAHLYHPILGVMGVLFIGLYSASHIKHLMTLLLGGSESSRQSTKPLFAFAALTLTALVCMSGSFIGLPHIESNSNYLSQWFAPFWQMGEGALEWQFMDESYGADYRYGFFFVVVLVLAISGFAGFVFGKRDKGRVASLESHSAFSSLRLTLGSEDFLMGLYRRFVEVPLKQIAVFIETIVDEKVLRSLFGFLGQVWGLMGGVMSFKMSGRLNAYLAFIVFGLFCLLTQLI